MRRSRPFWRLTAPEQRLWHAYPTRDKVDLRSQRDRGIRPEVITALLLGDQTPERGHIPGIRLWGARITGELDLSNATLASNLQLWECEIEGTLRIVESVTKGIRLDGSRMRRVNAARARIDGVLAMNGATIEQGIRLDDARISGALGISDARLGRDPDRSEWAIRAGGVTVEGGAFLRGLQAEGGLRLPGAQLSGGLHMERATIRAGGGLAIFADGLRARVVELSDGFSAEGSVRLRGARIDGRISFDRARLSAEERTVHLSHARVEELFFTPESITGEVTLAYSRFSVIYSLFSSYPAWINLNDTHYESLRPHWRLADRLAWVSRHSDGYRPQPYEQLAAWYRRIGQEHHARRVLHAKQRSRRRTFGVPGRVWGYLLDGVVGYGYRPWLAGIWAALLLAAGTIVFHLVPPDQIGLDEARSFNSFVYTLDLLVPVSVFEQRGAWEPLAGTQWLAWGIIVAGWVLATALIAGATRTLRP